MRITVALTASSEGRKLKPYVLVPRKRPIPGLEEKFRGKLIIVWAGGNTWMNDERMADYLKRVIGGKLFGNKRLLAMDALAPHKSEATKKVLKELDIETAIIPGGCTKYIQVTFMEILNFRFYTGS